ncbi:hypothetical protein [Janibacter sp. GXQ6167]|uniref:hypothetical protein n=1 Tax=Janibacter sp. GXQ6167 TaxID=3240791 RepID=UPI00352507F1
MSILDSMRIESAIQRLDFWMEYYGVPRARRRVERKELRAVLRSSAAELGSSNAVEQIDHPRMLARAMAEGRGRRPRWVAGTYAALAVLVIVSWSLMLSTFAFADGVFASEVRDREVAGSVFPWIGSRFTAEVTDTAFSVSVAGVAWAILLPVVVGLIVARPWRLLSSS